MIVLDFETRSTTPITAGAHKYAEQAEILCMSYAINEGPVQIWKPLEGQLFPFEVYQQFDRGEKVYAHNAEFEHAIFSECLPTYAPKPEQFICTATMAAACGLPRSLDAVGRCLGLPMQKQTDGRMLIQECCVPPFNTDQALLDKLYAYCQQDVAVTRTLIKCLRQPDEQELADQEMNLIINQRGIPVDLELAELAQHYAEEETRDLVMEIHRASGGELSKKSGTKLTQWVYENLPPAGQELMQKGEKISLDKSIRTELLESEIFIDPDVHKVIECADLAGRSSVSKYRTMQLRAQDDSRVRGCYVMNGAASTGRYSSHGLQMHNLPRTSMEDPDAIIAQMKAKRPLDDCMQTLSHMLRPAIKSGTQLAWCDWSAIEGRVLPWLADSPAAEEKLNLYREGQDVYVYTAAAMMGCDLSAVDKQLRQTGKVAELSLGYAGGAGALHAMGRNYGQRFTDASANHIKEQWRNNNNWAVVFWNQLDRAAHQAFRNPHDMQTAGRVGYLYTPEVLMGALWCYLPSGRTLCYPGVKRELVMTPWGEEQYQLSAIKGNLKPKAGDKEWPRNRLWKGLLAENVTQAVAADILRNSMRLAVLAFNLPVIGHTHDEIILETDSARDIAMLKKIMEQAPAWAEGLPLDAEMGQGPRYGK